MLEAEKQFVNNFKFMFSTKYACRKCKAILKYSPSNQFKCPKCGVKISSKIFFYYLLITIPLLFFFCTQLELSWFNSRAGLVLVFIVALTILAFYLHYNKKLKISSKFFIFFGVLIAVLSLYIFIKRQEQLSQVGREFFNYCEYTASIEWNWWFDHKEKFDKIMHWEDFFDRCIEKFK